MQIKSFLLAAVTLAAAILTSPAQTNTLPAMPPFATNSLIGGIKETLESVGISMNPSNWAAAPFLGVSTSGGKLAAGLVLVENVNDNVGVAFGIDHLWFGGKAGSANIVSGGLNLKQATHPLQFLGLTGWSSNLVATPYVLALTGTPVNGTGNNGGLALITRAGVAVDVYEIKGWKFSALVDYGNRSGAGNYNGNYCDLGLAIRKGF